METESGMLSPVSSIPTSVFSTTSVHKTASTSWWWSTWMAKRRPLRKPHGTDETLGIAIDLADPLEKAHRSGIVHRYLSERLPIVFIPVSPPPYMNEGPRDYPSIAFIRPLLIALTRAA